MCMGGLQSEIGFWTISSTRYVLSLEWKENNIHTEPLKQYPVLQNTNHQCYIRINKNT